VAQVRPAFPGRSVNLRQFPITPGSDVMKAPQLLFSSPHPGPATFRTLNARENRETTDGKQSDYPQLA
jgi:hypothetical protein